MPMNFKRKNCIKLLKQSKSEKFNYKETYFFNNWLEQLESNICKYPLRNYKQ